MDLKDFFRATDGLSDVHRHRAYRSTRAWQWRTLMHFAKPTIAMVNGWCFGGAWSLRAAIHARSLLTLGSASPLKRSPARPSRSNHAASD